MKKRFRTCLRFFRQPKIKSFVRLLKSSGTLHNFLSTHGFAVGGIRIADGRAMRDNKTVATISPIKKQVFGRAPHLAGPTTPPGLLCEKLYKALLPSFSRGKAAGRTADDFLPHKQSDGLFVVIKVRTTSKKMYRKSAKMTGTKKF